MVSVIAGIEGNTLAWCVFHCAAGFVGIQLFVYTLSESPRERACLEWVQISEKLDFAFAVLMSGWLVTHDLFVFEICSR